MASSPRLGRVGSSGRYDRDFIVSFRLRCTAPILFIFNGCKFIFILGLILGLISGLVSSPLSIDVGLHQQTYSLFQSARAEKVNTDPWRAELLVECSRADWRGLAATLTLSSDYPEESLKSCESSLTQPLPIGQIRSVKGWVIYQNALKQRDLEQALRFKPLLGLLDNAHASIHPLEEGQSSVNKVAPLRSSPHMLGDYGLFNADFIDIEDILELTWPLPKKVRSLSLAYRGSISIWLDGELLSQPPTSEEMWIDQTTLKLPLPATLPSSPPTQRRLTIKLRAGAQVIPRTHRYHLDLPPSLWERGLNRLDQRPQSVSDPNLISLAVIAGLKGVSEQQRVLPIIELDQRWRERPTLGYNQAFSSLTPPHIRAQAWGDYPLSQSLEAELNTAKGKRGNQRINTQHQLLNLAAYYDHLHNDRLHEARLTLESVAILPWLEDRYLVAELELLQRLGLSDSLFSKIERVIQTERAAGRSPYDRFPQLMLRYITLLNENAESLALDYFITKGAQAHLETLVQKDHLSPTDIQWLTLFLLSKVSVNDMWRRALKSVTRGPFGELLWMQLYNVFLKQQKPERLRAISDSPPSSLHLLFNHRDVARRQTFLTNERLGGETPWSMSEMSLDSTQPQSTKQKAISSVRTLYQHIDYRLTLGKLTRVERRVLQPMTLRGVKSLLTVSVPHSPSRQNFTIDHVKHLRPSHSTSSHSTSSHSTSSHSTPYRGDQRELSASFRSLSLPPRSQRSLSRPEDRLYYDLISEEINFEDLQVGDLIDVQWSLSEREADPNFILPHSDLLYLQDRTMKRCFIVSLDKELSALWTPTIDLKGLSSQDSCSIDATHHRAESKTLLNLRSVPPLKLEPLSPRGTSINPYVHFSNIHSWVTISALYRELLKPLLKPTGSVKRMALRWTAKVTPWSGESSDRARYENEAITALYLNITQSTRYVGLEFGRHSFEPTSPDLTLQRQLGDCKDRAVLLMSLGASLGIPLHFVMARTLSAGRLKPSSVASLSSFDHALVYSPTLNRYFDATLSHFDPQILPAPLHGAQALHVNGLIESTNSAIKPGLLVDIPSPKIPQVGVEISLLMHTKDPRREIKSLGQETLTSELVSEIVPRGVFFILRGERAMEIRRELDQVSPDDYDSRLKRYFPQLNHPQLSLNIDDQVESLSLLDPLVFYFSIDDSSSHPNDMLQEVMKINLSDRLSVISSTRKNAAPSPDESSGEMPLYREFNERKSSPSLVSVLAGFNRASTESDPSMGRDQLYR